MIQQCLVVEEGKQCAFVFGHGGNHRFPFMNEDLTNEIRLRAQLDRALAGEPPMFELYREPLLRLLTEKSFEKKPVILSSGKASDFYINVKRSLTPMGLKYIGNLFCDAIIDTWRPTPGLVMTAEQQGRYLALNSLARPVGVGGLTMGADPLAVATSMAAMQRGCELSPFYIRKEAKTHGSMAWWEGPLLPEGSNVVILEDVLTTGASAIRAIERARMHLVNPVLVLAVVDRSEENGRANIEATGVQVKSLFTRKDFL